MNGGSAAFVDNDDDDRRDLCRMDLAPVTVVKTPSSDTPSPPIVSALELEDCLEACVVEMVGGEVLPPVRYHFCPDMTWLDCGGHRSRETSKHSTLTGLLEEVMPNADTDELVDRPIQVTVWKTTDVGEKDCGDACPCLGPRRSWTSQRLHYTPPPSSLALKDANPFDPSLTADIQYVDARSRRRQEDGCLLPNAAAVTHFLRSLLGCSHEASPWAPQNPLHDDNKNTVATLETTCVLLLLDEDDYHVLRQFRVSDACPSWCLYSSISVLLGAHQEYPWSDISDDEPLQPAQLFVYRRLPHRQSLFSKHPVSSDEATTGCLWERFLPTPIDDQKDANTGEIRADYRMVSPPYIDCSELYPGLFEPLLKADNWAILQQEAQRIPLWTAWPEQAHYQVTNPDDPDAPAPWNVFPLCYCFPADKVQPRQWVPLTTAHVPRTVSLLKEHLGDSLRTALFSRLDPGAVLEAHTGWADLANHVYRVHLPLIVPPGDLCGTWVDGCVATHETAKPLAFDDSKIHRAFNYSNQDRIVLILDVARPKHLPLGRATGGHSEELDAFIAQMNVAK